MLYNYNNSRDTDSGHLGATARFQVAGAFLLFLCASLFVYIYVYGRKREADTKQPLPFTAGDG